MFAPPMAAAAGMIPTDCKKMFCSTVVKPNPMVAPECPESTIKRSGAETDRFDEITYVV